MKVTKWTSSAALAAIFSIAALPTTQAVESPSGKDINPWTDCGLGAMIFSDYPVAAGISNVIWDLGTTAVTSATASDNTCEGGNVKTAALIQKTYSSIEDETVRGGGEHVTAALELMGCDAAAHGGIIEGLRADLAETMSAPEYAAMDTTQKAQAYYYSVQAQVNGPYAGSCQI